MSSYYRLQRNTDKAWLKSGNQAIIEKYLLSKILKNPVEVKYFFSNWLMKYEFSARLIYKAAANTNRHDFRLEDMFFTGILRRKANLQGKPVIKKNKT